MFTPSTFIPSTFMPTTIQPRAGYEGLPNHADEPVIEIPAESPLTIIDSDLELGAVLRQMELEPHPDDDLRSAGDQGRLLAENQRCGESVLGGVTRQTTALGGALGAIAGAVIGATELSKIHGQTPETGALWGALAGGSTGAVVGAAIGLSLTGCGAASR